MEKERAGKVKIRKKSFMGSGIKRRWVFNNLSIVLLIISIIFTIGGMFITNYYYESIRGNLINRANSTSNYINRYMTESYNQFYSFTKELVSEYSDKDKVEMQVIDLYGRVMFSSTGLLAGFSPTASDIDECMNTKKVATFIGFDQISEEKIAAVTAPVNNQSGQLIGAVRFVSSTKVVDRQLRNIYLILIVGAAAIILLIFITNQFFLRSIVNPVLKINELAYKIAQGQYGVKLNLEFNDELGELCSTLNNMSEEIARMEKLKNDFISSVSHELRTPLTAIGGWTETIAVDFTDKKTMAQGLNIIHKETMRLSQMVEELLDFSRMESGRLKLQTEVFDMRGELYDAVFIYTETLKQEGMQVNYNEPEEVILVNGDKHRMKQVFLNIIDNAAKYGRDGNKIDINIEKDEDCAIVKIRDYGQGIPAGELPFVKDKFFKGSSKQRGAGIGLAVCTEIVALHDGNIDIDSVYGEGTEVAIRIPLAVESV